MNIFYLFQKRKVVLILGGIKWCNLQMNLLKEENHIIKSKGAENYSIVLGISLVKLSHFCQDACSQNAN